MLLYALRRVFAGTFHNLYSVFGDSDNAFTLSATSPFYHAPTFGSHFAGVSSAFADYCEFVPASASVFGYTFRNNACHESSETPIW
eukprot:SAG11_NODE_20220_length_450_cov_0.732194_1_plen_85_part_10